MKTIAFRKGITSMFLLISCYQLSFAVENTTSFEVKYDFSSVVSGQGGRIDPTIPPEHEHISFSSFRAVAEQSSSALSEHSSTKAQFSFAGWSVNQSLDLSSIDLSAALSCIDKEQYYEFSISPHNGYAVILDKINYKMGRTATGPRLFAVSSSYDHHESLLPVAYLGSSDVVTVMDHQIFFWADESSSLSNHQVLIDKEIKETLTIRFYAWAAEDEKGKFSIDNVELSGSVYACEEDQGEVDPEIQHPDTLYFQQSFDHFQLPEDSSFIEFSVEGISYRQEIRVTCPYVEAVVNLYNSQDSLMLHIEDVSVNIMDENGDDLTDRFQVLVETEAFVHPVSESAILMRMIPDKDLYDKDSAVYRLSGQFVSYYEEEEKQHHVLYPQTFSLQAVALPQLAYIFPPDTSSILIRAYNANPDRMTLPFVWKSNASAVAQVDTIRMEALNPFDYKEWSLGMPFESGQFSCNRNMSSEYAPDVTFYHLIRDIESHHLLIDQEHKEDSLQLFMQDGRVEDVFLTDSLLSMEWQNDTCLQIAYENNGDAWKLAVLAADPHLDSLQLNRWLRADGSDVSSAYYWQTQQACYLLDTLIQQDTVVYQLEFSWIQDRTIYVSLYDSICLGDNYQSNGFDLPVFSQAGDYVFHDTLLTVNKIDSIVSLYLNVCDKPMSPEQIYGDSIIVEAGTYVYTIKPVPNAAFYVWTVLPDSWIVDSQANTMSLTIPYPGEGAISVSAVNRCGSSEEKSMHINADQLTDLQTANFSVYPGSDANSFNLYAKDLQGKTTLIVYDMTGRILYQESRMIQNENEVFSVSLEDYAGAMYMISIINEQGKSSTMVLKE